MRQHHRMGFGVRRIEGTAERVADLVMQRHADGAEHRTAEPGTIKRIAARLGILRIVDDNGQAPLEGAKAFERHQARNRIAVLCIESLNGMGHGVEAARHAHGDRQPECQRGVVNHDLRQDLCIAHRRLAAAFGLAENRRHLRSGIGRGNDDLEKIGTIGDRLAEPRRRSAAEGNDAIGLRLRHDFHRRLRHLDGRVHRCACKHAASKRSDLLHQHLGIRLLMWRRQNQSPPAASFRDPFHHLAAATRTEDNPGWAARIGKISAHPALPGFVRTMTKVRLTALPGFPSISAGSKQATSSGRTPKRTSSARCGSLAS